MDNAAQGERRINDEGAPEEVRDNFQSDETESGVNEQETGTTIQAELSYLSGSKVNFAGRDIIFNFSRGFGKQAAREIVRELMEVGSSQRLSSPPPHDASLQEKVDYWFREELVTDREKLFVVTLSIFNGLKYPDFCEIYDLVLEEFDIRNNKEKPSTSMFEDDALIQEQFKAELSRSNDGLEEIIQFKNRHYQSAVFDLLRRRYRRILLKLLPVLKLVVERHRYWEIRSKAAASVAEIGKISFYQVINEVLKPWASDQRAYVRAAVGYPLARLVEDDRYRNAVCELLDEWANPRWRGAKDVWRCRWSAASAYKQIGLVQLDWTDKWVFSGLKKLAGFDDIRIADAVIHSLVVLSLQRHLIDVLLALKVWIEEGSAGTQEDIAPQARCVVALMAFMVMSEIHIQVEEEIDAETNTLDEIPYRVENLFEIVRQNTDGTGDIWQLIVSVGVRAFEYELTESFFLLISRWTQIAKGEPVLQNIVRNLLADVFSQLRPLEKDHIWNQLTRWEKQTDDKHLAEMALSAKAIIKTRVLHDPDVSATSQNRIQFGS